MKPRALLLSYAFPPAAVPEAVLSAKRLGSLSDFDVDVIAMQPAGSAIRIDRSLDSYVADRFGRIERIGIPNLLQIATRGKASAVFQIPGLFHVMNRKALQAALRLNPGRYAAIVTWSQWHSIHLVGLALKRRFAAVPWVAHFSDPWTDNPFAAHGPMRPYMRRLESKVYRAADALSFTSRETIDLVFRGASDAMRAKAAEIPHLFDPDLYPTAPSPIEGPLLVRSLGNFYGPRSPEPVLKALIILRERNPALFGGLRVELIGSIPAMFSNSPAFRALPPTVVQLRTPVDYRSSLALMKGADLLLNIDAPFESSVFLPSKLVDYIGAQRPVVGVTPPGTASRIIRELGGWVAEPGNAEAVAAVLEAALSEVQRNRGAPWGNRHVYETYSRAKVAAQFSELIRRISAKPPSRG